MCVDKSELFCFFNTVDWCDIHMGALNKTSKIIYKVRPETDWKKLQTVFGFEQLLYRSEFQIKEQTWPPYVLATQYFLTALN